VRRLIVNADDFGFTRGVNRAIAEAHRSKVVTSATLMACGADFEEAVNLAQAMPDLSVGCHVVLIGGSPVLPASEIPSLVSAQNPPSFRATWRGFASAALSGQLRPGEIEAEVAAQIRKLQERGMNVTHVDTHKHVHIFPCVLKPVLRAAQACGVKAIRNPFEPATFRLLARDFHLWQRWLGVGLLGAFRGAFRSAVQAAGMVAPEGCLGLVSTGRLSAASLNSIIECQPPGTWELVCHPGYNDAQLRGMQTRLLESRQEELKILSSGGILAQLADCGIELISYYDL
jgi:chitin disaccharide deacetylase